MNHQWTVQMVGGLRALLLLTFSLVQLVERCAGMEADCRACNHCQGKPDLKDELTQRVQKHIAEGKTIEAIAKFEGGVTILRPPIEVWANRHPAATKPDPAKLKYRGSRLPNNSLFTSFEPCIKVCEVCIGTDKLAHLFQQGWEYYQISVIDQRGDKLAERYGEWLEGKETKDKYADDEKYFKKQFSGRRVGYGGFGRTISGVISNADLAANKAGLQLYKDIQNGRFKSICDYVSSKLCEEINFNDYTPELRKIVEHNGRQ